MNALKTAFALAPITLFVACSDPASNVPSASVSTSTNAPTAAAQADAGSKPQAEARAFAFGPSNSSIEFVGSKVTGSHNGGFRNFVGELQVVNGKLADTGNKVVIDTTSIWSDNDRLTGHLKNPDFFDVEKFPTAVFETVSVSQQATNSLVTGNLMLHGVTKQISFPANIQLSDNAVDVNADFSINRFDFNMKYPGKADDLIRDRVVLKLKVKASPGKADFKSLAKPAQTAAK